MTKSILVVAPRNVDKDEEFLWGMGMKVVTGSLYLGDLIGDREAETTYLDKKVQGWTELERMLLGVDHKHPQSDYS